MGWENKSGQKYVKLEAQQKGHCAKTTRPFVVHLSGILTSSLSGSEFPDGQQKMVVSSHLSSLVHKRCGNTKSPRSLVNTGSAGFCTHGGQIVVTVVNSAEK